MKKFCGLSVMLLLFFSSVHAQSTSFGIKAGYNAATFKVNNGADYESKSGIHVGALAHIHITSHFAVQPELVYSSQGAELDNKKIKLNYLNVPVLLQYMVSDGFRIQTGPQVGFLLSAKQKVGDVTVDINDAVDNVDFSWTVGAGYLFHSGFGIDARYNIGLNNINNDGPGEAKNRVFQAGLFYQFNNNGKKK